MSFIENCRNYHYLKLMTDPYVGIKGYYEKVLTREAKSIPLKDKIHTIGAFFTRVGERLQVTHKKGVAQLCKKLLEENKGDAELQKTINGIFDRSILIREEMANTMPYVISPAPTSLVTLQKNLELIATNHPRFCLGSDLEVYDKSFHSLPCGWSQSNIYSKLESEFKKYEHKELAALKDRIETLYKPIIPVCLGILLDRGSVENPNTLGFQMCSNYIDAKIPFITLRYTFMAHGRRLAQEVSLAGWSLYYQKNGDFCLALPPNSKPENFGFCGTLPKWNRPFFSIPKFRETSSNEGFLDVFDFSQEVYYPKLVSLCGHGSYPGYPHEVDVNQPATIALLSAARFNQFIDVLEYIDTKALSLITCHAAGTNSTKLHNSRGTIPFPIFVRGAFESSVTTAGYTGAQFFRSASKVLFSRFSRQLQPKELASLASVHDAKFLEDTTTYYGPTNRSDIPKVGSLSSANNNIIDLDERVKKLQREKPHQKELTIIHQSPAPRYCAPLDYMVPKCVFSGPIVDATVVCTLAPALLSRGGQSHHLLKKLDMGDQPFEELLSQTFNILSLAANKAYYIAEVTCTYEGVATSLEKVLITYFNKTKQATFQKKGDSHFQQITFVEQKTDDESRWIPQATAHEIRALLAHAEFYFAAVSSYPSKETLYQTTAGRYDAVHFFDTLQESFWGQELPVDVKYYASVIDGKKESSSLSSFDREEIMKNGAQLALLKDKKSPPPPTNQRGKTVLHEAISEGKMSVSELKEVIDKNRSLLDRQDEDGETALHFAISMNRLEFVRLLIEERASLTIENKEHRSPLDLSCENLALLQAIKTLAQVDINTPNHEGLSPLGKALIWNDLELAQRWLDVGADFAGCSTQEPLLKLYLIRYVNSKIDERELFWFIYHLFDSECTFSAEEAKIPLKIDTSFYQIDVESIKFILKSRASSVVGDSLKIYEYLLHTIKGEHGRELNSLMPRLLPHLLQRGMNRERLKQILEITLEVYPVKQKNMPLIHAILNKSPVGVAQFLQEIASPRAAFECLYGFNPMSWAICFAEEATIPILSYLFSDPSLVHDSDWYNNSPLHWAVILKKPDVVKLLIDCGADLEAKNQQRYKPMELDINPRLGNLVI